MKTYGTQIDKLPVELVHVEDIEYFDGPLLSEYWDEANKSWLSFWCDVESGVRRWLTFRSTREAIDSYRKIKTDDDTAPSQLRAIILAGEDFYFVDAGNATLFYKIEKSDLLQTNYLPKPSHG